VDRQKFYFITFVFYMHQKNRLHKNQKNRLQMLCFIIFLTTLIRLTINHYDDSNISMFQKN
jgi:hypothetical protein